MNQEPERVDHTTGPWEVQTTDTGMVYVQSPESDETICRVMVEDEDDVEGILNANLIAAAPELLEELERLASVFFNAGDKDNWRSVKLVIKKALGE